MQIYVDILFYHSGILTAKENGGIFWGERKKSEIAVDDS